MTIPEFCIRRPVMTTLLMVGIFLFGVIGYRALPVSELPNVDFPTILVSANLPGASAETMASSVATPLEKQFSTIAGIDSMNSLNAIGMTQITVQFALDRNIDAAAQDIQSAIVASQKNLPVGMPVPPTYQKVNPADQPILFLALSSPYLPLSQIDSYAQNMIAQRISTIEGVAQVQVFGSQKYAVRAQLDPNALASRGIGIDEVATAISGGNVNIPTGTLYGHHQAFSIQATGQLTNAAAYRKLIVAYRNGSPIRLEEVGRVIDSVQNDKIASWYKDTRAIVLAIQRQPGTNTVQVAEAIKKLLPDFRSQMPASVRFEILYDRSVSIMDSIKDVKFSLLLAIALVVMVIFLFLRKISATVIPSLALPISLMGTFAILYLLGYSIDNLSLMALTLCVGFVVDDAIVMLENIVRHLEKGEDIMTASLTGSREIGFTILSMTISLAAVFIPVLFMQGILGRLLHEFSVTIITAIVVSGIVSLTLTPMLCSRVFRNHHEEKHGALYILSERFFEGWLRLYDRTLQFALKHRPAVMILFTGLFVASIYLFNNIPKGFIPNGDTGMIFAFTQGAQDISFESMKTHQQALAKIVQDDPYVESFMSAVGAGGPNVTGNTGRIFMRLKPRSERPDVDKVIQELRVKLSTVPGIRAFPQNLPMIRIGGQLTKSLYQYTLQDVDLRELYHWAPLLEAKLRTLPGFQDVNSDLEITTPQIMVDINRDKASSLGVTADQIETTLYNAYGSRQVSTIYT
ncbi:MAG: efflux RND transporter permease subunit, partial [Nitrospirae bacterium]|nr:efflux RND transporter permease subunit [Nitrospirota bacterium]